MVLIGSQDPDNQYNLSLLLGIMVSYMTFLIEKGLLWILLPPSIICEGKNSSIIDSIYQLDKTRIDEVLNNRQSPNLYKITLDNVPKLRYLLNKKTSIKDILIENRIIFNENLTYKELLN